MAEEKKAKIDLKSRLQKRMGATPAPGAQGSTPPPRSIPAPPMATPPPGSVPPPPSFDPTNPLAAAAGYRPSVPPSAPPPPPPKPQEIVVDEQHVDEAKSSVYKKMSVVTALAAAVTFGVGWMLGGASADSKQNAKGREDARAIAADVKAAKGSVDDLWNKLKNAESTLKTSFPDTLHQELQSLNLAYDGSKLTGKRFSVVSPEVAADIIDFATAMTVLKQRKIRLMSMLEGKNKTAVVDELAALKKKEQPPVSYVMVIPDKNQIAAGGILTMLEKPWSPTKEKPSLPEKLMVANPGKAGTADEMPRLTGDKFPDKGPFAIVLQPETVLKAFPPDNRGRLKALRDEIASLMAEIDPPQGDSVADQNKVGISKRAERIYTALEK